uniref:Uncharacterized protein n=1 Tax=Macaca fascicularis TaxID=9541 RepID=A0A7N9D9H8_MACFA
MCKWRVWNNLVSPQNISQCRSQCLILKNSSRAHVHNVQLYYVCIHVPCWCAEPINSSFTLGSSFHDV